MPRPPRIHLENGFYHVTLRGNHREPVFRVEADRHLLNAIVARVIAQSDARVHAFCWMTNHIHLLVQIGTAPLGGIVRQIASGYARAFQRKLDTSGHLFERRYHARLVAADEYLLVLVRYIHLNPVTAGMATLPGAYPWSSHHAYAGSGGLPWVTTDFVLRLFAAERDRAHAAYRLFVAEGDPTWEPKDEPTELELSLLSETLAERMPKFELPIFTRQTFDSLLDEACRRFGIRLLDLMSDSRDSRLVQARGWVGREAVNRRVANLSEVARALGRDRATLRYAIRRLGAGNEP